MTPDFGASKTVRNRWKKGASIRAMKRIGYAVRRAYRLHATYRNPCRAVGVLAPIEHRQSTN